MEIFISEYKRKNSKLHEKNYSIVFFSNQLGISKNKVDKEDIIYKVNEIVKKINVPILTLLSIKDDNFRKPRIGLWNYLKENNKIEINKKNSFYVGDMAGRLLTKDYKKDRSDSDRKFAINIKIKFFTPESFFLNLEERKWKLNDYLLDYKNFDNQEINFIGDKIMVLISGYPASGKTTLSKKLENFTLFSKDLYGKKIINKLKESLKKNNNVIIEGLLYNYEKRKIYIDLGKKYNYIIKYIDIKLPLELCYHMNIYRSLIDKTEIIPKVVFYTYRKRYEKPDEKNFNEVINYYTSFKKNINDYYLY